MRLLFAANNIFTFLTRREDKYLNASVEVIQECVNHKIDGFIALHTLSILWYLLRCFPLEKRIASMSFICDTFTIAYANNAMISHALQNTAFTDFEDNLQDCCAQQVKADYIVTANIKDYAGHSVIPAITPSDLLTLLKDYNSIPYYHTDDNQPCELRESHLEYEISPHISRSASYHKHFISKARHLTCTLVA